MRNALEAELMVDYGWNISVNLTFSTPNSSTVKCLRLFLVRGNQMSAHFRHGIDCKSNKELTKVQVSKPKSSLVLFIGVCMRVWLQEHG